MTQKKPNMQHEFSSVQVDIWIELFAVLWSVNGLYVWGDMKTKIIIQILQKQNYKWATNKYMFLPWIYYVHIYLFPHVCNCSFSVCSNSRSGWWRILTHLGPSTLLTQPLTCQRDSLKGLCQRAFKSSDVESRMQITTTCGYPCVN